MADKYFNQKPLRGNKGIVTKILNPEVAIGGTTLRSHIGGDAAGPAGIFVNATYSNSFGLVNPLINQAGAVVGLQMSQEQIQISFTFEPRVSSSISIGEAEAAGLRAGDLISLHYHADISGSTSADAVTSIVDGTTASTVDPVEASVFHVTDVSETSSNDGNRQFTVNAIQYEGRAFVQLS